MLYFIFMRYYETLDEAWFLTSLLVFFYSSIVLKNG